MLSVFIYFQDLIIPTKHATGPWYNMPWSLRHYQGQVELQKKKKYITATCKCNLIFTCIQNKVQTEEKEVHVELFI